MNAIFLLPIRPQLQGAHILGKNINLGLSTNTGVTCSKWQL